MPNSTARISRFWLFITSALVGLLAATLIPLNAHADDSTSGTGEPGWKDGHVPRGLIVSKIRRMTLEEKVGQLFMVRVYGESVDTTDPDAVASNQRAYGVDNAEQLIEQYHLGGIIYYTWTDNLKNPTQIAELSNGLQRVATDQRLPIPMMISIDQEQGLVTRIGPPATQFPGNMALGAGRSTEDAYTAARITGQELRALGINQNFAPVADVNVNPKNPVIGVRSFGSEPSMVAEMTAAAVAGYEEGAGIGATAKHFPGHGDTTEDSHIELPMIDHTREEWERIDAPPFKAAIEQGIGAIMTAHVTFPALDPSGDPATLSKPIMTGLLREELGFDGVIVTDALSMGAVREEYGDDRVPVLAIKAGADILLKPPEGKLDLQYHAVLEAVRSGEISEQRINESVFRILRLKFQNGLFQDPYVDVNKIDDVVGTPEHLAAAQEITDRTTTLVKNDADVLPLATPAEGGPGDVLVTGFGVSTTATLAERIKERGPDTTVFETGSRPSPEEIDQAVAKAGEHDLTVVTTYRAWAVDSYGSGQINLVEELVATGTPVVVIAVRDPYDIAYFTEARTYLATYSYEPVSLESAAKVLFGEISPTGRLPVMVPVAGDPETPLYEYGHGLSYND